MLGPLPITDIRVPEATAPAGSRSCWLSRACRPGMVAISCTCVAQRKVLAEGVRAGTKLRESTAGVRLKWRCTTAVNVVSQRIRIWGMRTPVQGAFAGM